MKDHYTLELSGPVPQVRGTVFKALSSAARFIVDCMTQL
jgi:hypothetical protein